MIQTIIKRDGRTARYDRSKIYNAIWKAVQSCGGTDKKETESITDTIEEGLGYRDSVGVEEIQDLVEKTLIERGHAKVAKSYILYRADRNKRREMNTALMKTYEDLVIEQLLERFKVQAQKKVKNYPFLMGQGVWIDSDKLKPEDEVGEVLKHGTLSMGFIGLAECLIALKGKHHGEDAEAQKLGIEIVTYMRRRMDKAMEETGLNFSLLATPAEGLSGRFVRIDKKRFGIIEGITDRDYYTNSFHVPVYYNTTAWEKIQKEAPYHALTNAGHISYIEMDGDPLQNLEAFEQIVRCMKESEIGYGAINHPVDHDPVCGYTGIIGDSCPRCGRKETEKEPFERIRRITGYLVGTLDRFNDAKRAEEKDRVKHEVKNDDHVDRVRNGGIGSTD